MPTILLLLVWLCSAAAVGAQASATYYVKSPAARLLVRPNMGAGGPALAPGTAVTKIGEEGLFFRVRVDGRTGWVSRLYVSPNAVRSAVVLRFAGKRKKSVEVRVRASAYTQTAAARGLSKSATVRVRGGQHEYDFESIDWLEGHKPTTQALAAFWKEGGLRPGP